MQRTSKGRDAWLEAARIFACELTRSFPTEIVSNDQGPLVVLSAADMADKLFALAEKRFPSPRRARGKARGSR